MSKGSTWTAYLSDGRSINEKDLLVPNEELPFKKLVRYCVKNDLQINAVTLFINGVRINGPSMTERGNFVSAIKPEKFWILYRERFMPLQGRAISFMALTWKVENIRTFLWVALSDPTICWFELRKAEGATEELIEQVYKGE
jgi:hypothetical protein